MMAKQQSVFSLAFFLLAVAAICGFLLATVHGKTSPLIAKMQAEAILAGYTEVYPGMDKVRTATYDGKTAGVINIQLVEKDGKTAGVIYNVSSEGYAGTIDILVGFDIAGQKISGVKVIKQSETPGLGANCTSPKFIGQFADKNAAAALTVVKSINGGANDIQAITASTITSRAVVHGVNIAREHFAANYAGK